MKRNKHFSHNSHHNFPRGQLSGSWWYAGTSNHGKALQNIHNSHRWSTGQRDGDTFCVKAPKADPNRVVARWRGYKYYKVPVRGTVTSQAIHEACKGAGLVSLFC